MAIPPLSVYFQIHKVKSRRAPHAIFTFYAFQAFYHLLLVVHIIIQINDSRVIRAKPLLSQQLNSGDDFGGWSPIPAAMIDRDLTGYFLRNLVFFPGAFKYIRDIQHYHIRLAGLLKNAVQHVIALMNTSRAGGE